MRRKNLFSLTLLWLLAACAPAATVVTPTPPAAPTTPPPASPIVTCLTDGLKKCLPDVWQAYGVSGLLLLALAFLLSFFLFTPLGKVLQERSEEWLRSLPLLRGKRPSPPEIERGESDYLLGLRESLDPKDPAAELDAYLRALRKRENPLKYPEDRLYVPLEGGLSEDLAPRLGLHLGGPAEARRSWWARLTAWLRPNPQPFDPQQLFREQRTFENLEEALGALDDRTGQPYAVLALLGEPGAGKSTLMRRFARLQVERRLADPNERLPFFVSLSAHRSGTPLTFLRQAWKEALGFDGLEEALADGKIWLFADGLNEMPRAGYEMRLAQWRAFLHSDDFAARGNRALVACRIADYGEGIGAPRLVIHDMDEERIRDFLEKRIPDRAAALWRQLEQDRRDGRGDMYALAQVPFWLVMLTRVSGQKGLPPNRAALLDEFLCTWLDYEASRPGGRLLSDAHRQAFVEGLTRLAWRGLERSQNYTFPRAEAVRILNAAQTALSADDLLALGRDCSLLDLTPFSVRFQHQLWQEFFAAREFARRFTQGQNLRPKWRTPWRRWKFVRSRWDPLPPPPRTGWEETIVLAAGLLPPPQAGRLLQAVLADNRPLAGQIALQAGLDLPAETLKTLRGRLLDELQAPRVRLPARLEAGRSLARLGDPRLLERRHTWRDAAGKEKACIEPDWAAIPAGEFVMGCTPRQALRLRLFHRFAPGNDELPAHRVFVSAFEMARWPVTVAEYRCFMEAGGYEEDAWWQAPGALRWRDAPLPFEESYLARYIQWLRQNEAEVLKSLQALERRGALSPAQAEAYREQMNMQDDALRQQWERFEVQRRDERGRAVRPWLWEESEFKGENQPVIGVTWYEACAYAAWLDAALRALGRLPEGWRIRLPREAEWEKAARWRGAGAHESLWPWGDRWDAACANTLEGRVMRPSPVGAYPRGSTPAGLLDMAGNVWEWCADWYAPDTYRLRAGQVTRDPVGPEQGDLRVLRGGAWNYDRSFARCAYRDRRVPDDFFDGIGFRLVRSPSSPSLNSESLHSESLTPPPPP
jgi:formylglycine-generating enzyme required for sulfatase activity